MRTSKIKSNLVKNIFNIIIILVLVSVLSLTVVSCKRIVIGSGNIISEERDVSGFDKISISGSGKLYIEQGDTESLTIKAEDNVMPLIETRVFGNTLNIGFKPGTSVTTNKGIEFHLNVRELKRISGSGSGDIYCGALNTDALSIDISGSRKIDIGGLDVNSIVIDSSGSGNITLSGSADSLDIESSGSTKYHGEDLESKTCTINSSGSGELVVNVSDELVINASGSVRITYIGNPSVSQRISGSATIDSK